jgi:hypothetical protein
VPVLGHYCLFSRSGNLPFLKPNLIERYANGARCWCGPLGSSGALAAPRRSPQRRAEGSTFPPKKLMSVRNRTNRCALHGGAWGICTMPSSEYFRRQADICLRLSMIASSEEVANRLIAIAQDYTGRADEIEADSTMAMPTMTAPSASPDRETNQT